jgi:hypothetical protein
MRKTLLLLGCSALTILLLGAGGLLRSSAAEQGEHAQHENPTNAVYHWKTIFNPTVEELAFLETHNVGRLYIRMFDIGCAHDYAYDKVMPAPIATTRFDAPIPAGVEVVPVTYITLDALRLMEGREHEYAHTIVDRMVAMMSYNECGEMGEVQFDCDWTGSTEGVFFALCHYANAYLDEMGVDLSITVRLHQLNNCDVPEADRGVLMLYNTGAIKSPETRNSILDIADVKPYLRGDSYAIPLDYAYPTFGWGVKFRDGIFHSLVSDPATATLAEGETMREERASIDEILTVKRWVEESQGAPYQCNIVYHLDNEELKNYTYDEISEIFSRN